MTRKRSRLISLLLALIVTGVGFLIWDLARARYTARARLLVAAAVPKVLFQTVETEGRNDDYRRYQLTQVALVKSQMVLNAALQDSNGKVNAYRMIREQADPITWLQNSLNVEFVAGSEVMEIGLSGDRPDEIAGIVNAVKTAYIEEVANADTKLRMERHAKLKKIKDNYAKILKERQETQRILAEAATGDKLRMDAATKFTTALYPIFATQYVQIRLDRAEVETLLARRKPSAAASDQVRKEIGQLDDRLAVLTAREKEANEQMGRLHLETSAATIPTLDLTLLDDDVALIKDVARKVGAEIEALNIELEAPPRIRMIEDAVPPTQRSFVTERILAMIFNPSSR
jgi:uncharacterized protein involved in exopolysaccharide biosynthesis